MTIGVNGDRRPHFISRSRGDSLPQRWVALDCGLVSAGQLADGRTRLEKLDCWSAVVYDNANSKRQSRGQFCGLTAHSLWRRMEYLSRQPGVTWVFVMNASRVLTACKLWDQLDAKRFVICGDDFASSRAAGSYRDSTSTGFCIVDDPPTIIQIKQPGLPGTIRIVDVRNYGIESYADMAEGNADPVNFQCTEQDSAELRLRVAGEKAVTLAAFVHSLISFVSSNDCGSLKTTGGSQAWHTFKRRFIANPILCHVNEPALALERRALYGGRCECMRIGKVDGPIYYLDYKSLYTWVCAQRPMPTELMHYETFVCKPGSCDLKQADSMIADVLICTTKPKYPKRQGGLTVYPTGRFWTTLCGWELADAVITGAATVIGRRAYYKMEYALSGYADWILALQLQYEVQHNRPIAMLLKKMGVALPAHFGMSGRRWVDAPEQYAPYPYYAWYEAAESGEMQRWRSIGWHCQKEVVTQETNDSCPAIYAFVTSYGRMQLREAMAAVKQGKLYYVDTDSVWVDRQGYSDLLSSGLCKANVPGYLRIKGIYHSVEFRGVKYYVADGKVTCAGTAKGSQDVVDMSTERWQREWLANALKQRRSPQPLQRLQKQRVNVRYRLGNVLSDGTVEPFEIMEG